MSASPPATRRSAGSVQSIERAFSVLELLAQSGGRLGVSQLAAEAELPLPTIHRLLRTLVELGYVRQEESRQYVLGPRLIRLGDASARMLAVWARPHLAHVVAGLGESANLAMLDGAEIVYVAQVQSHHSMRMFTEVGRRVSAHCTAVGKAILSTMPAAAVHEILKRSGMPRYTETTITDSDEFEAQLKWSATHGYAVDEGEQEIGVRCVAVAVPQAFPRLAISVSGPAGRVTADFVTRAVPLLAQAGEALAADLGANPNAAYGDDGPVPSAPLRS